MQIFKPRINANYFEFTRIIPTAIGTNFLDYPELIRTKAEGKGTRRDLKVTPEYRRSITDRVPNHYRMITEGARCSGGGSGWAAGIKKRQRDTAFQR